MKFFRIVCLTLLIIILSIPNLASAQSEKELQNEITQLQSRVRALEDYILTIKPTFEDFNKNADKTFNKFFEHTQASLNTFAGELHSHLNKRMEGLDNKRIVLDPVNRGYRKIETSSGDFLLSVKSFKPVFGGGGYRLIFHVGNPNYASYKGVNLKLKWGEKYKEKSLQSYEHWEKSLKGASFKYNGTIRPGAWTEIGVDVPVASVKAMEYIECSMELDTVELNLRNPQQVQ